MATGKRDANRKVVLMGVSSADSVTTLPLMVDSVTGRLLVKVAGSEENTVVPSDVSLKRDDNRVPVTGGELNNAGRRATPFSIEDANEGLMLQIS